MALDTDSKTFVIYVAIRKQNKMAMYSVKKATIKAQVGILWFDKAFTAVLAKYSHYSNIFLAENVAELLEHTKINDYIIKLEKGKQSPFGPIYSLKQIELKTLKTYIKTNPANSFI